MYVDKMKQAVCLKTQGGEKDKRGHLLDESMSLFYRKKAPSRGKCRIRSCYQPSKDKTELKQDDNLLGGLQIQVHCLISKI